MKKIVLSLIISTVLVLCIASAGCIDGKTTINYSNSELESQIVQSLNELGADLSYPPFKISNEYYHLCLETSQYNSEGKDVSAEKVPDVSDIDGASSFSNIISVKELSGDLTSDAEVIANKLSTHIFTRENSSAYNPRGMPQKISISCVINDNVVSTSFVLSYEYTTLSYTPQELEKEIVQQYLNEVNKDYRQNTLYSDRFVNECRDDVKKYLESLFIEGKTYDPEFFIKDVNNKLLRNETHGEGVAIPSRYPAYWSLTNGKLTGDIHQDASIILDELRKNPSYGKQWQRVDVGCYMLENRAIGVTMFLFNPVYW